MLDKQLLRGYAMGFQGVPYIWGGDDPMRGFDCSGFAQEILTAFGAHPMPGVDLTAQALHDNLLKQKCMAVNEIGSLAFYGKAYNKITHVALVIGQDLIFEFGGGGSKTTSESEAIAQNAYGRIRPLNRRKDLVTCIMPKYP